MSFNRIVFTFTSLLMIFGGVIVFTQRRKDPKYPIIMVSGIFTVIIGALTLIATYVFF